VENWPKAATAIQKAKRQNLKEKFKRKKNLLALPGPALWGLQ